MTERKRWIAVATWAGIVITGGVAIAMLVTGIADRTDEGALDALGIEVPAEVLDVTVHDGGENGPTSTVTVRFKPRGDDLTKTTTDVSYDGDFVDEHPAASRRGTRIRYDPKDPEHARIVGESGDALDRVIGGAVGLIVVVGFTVVYVKRPDIIGW